MNHLVTRLEIKSLSEREFEGHGAIFGNVDLGGDTILPGAFKSLNSGRMPKMLYQHDQTKIAGLWTAMHEDSRGLYVKGRLINTPIGNQAYVEMKEGALDGLSIGYETVDSEGRNPRKLKEVNLWEVSLVTFPMNQAATIEAVKYSGASDIAAVLQSIQRLNKRLIDEIVR
jgi:Escherichia/Staphylococcus phage prohead protease